MATERLNDYMEFYQLLGSRLAFEVLVDKTGKVTSSYPHVQLTHRTNGSVDVIAWKSPRNHVFSETLNRPGGNQLHAVVEKAREWL